MRKWICIAVLGIGGCGMLDDRSGPTMHQKQDDALRDPMNYSPHADERRDISGGGMMDFKKDAFKRDLNSVFNP